MLLIAKCVKGKALMQVLVLSCSHTTKKNVCTHAKCASAKVAIAVTLSKLFTSQFSLINSMSSQLIVLLASALKSFVVVFID